MHRCIMPCRVRNILASFEPHNSPHNEGHRLNVMGLNVEQQNGTSINAALMIQITMFPNQHNEGSSSSIIEGESHQDEKESCNTTSINMRLRKSTASATSTTTPPFMTTPPTSQNGTTTASAMIGSNVDRPKFYHQLAAAGKAPSLTKIHQQKDQYSEQQSFVKEDSTTRKRKLHCWAGSSHEQDPEIAVAAAPTTNKGGSSSVENPIFNKAGVEVINTKLNTGGTYGDDVTSPAFSSNTTTTPSSVFLNDICSNNMNKKEYNSISGDSPCSKEHDEQSVKKTRKVRVILLVHQHLCGEQSLFCLN